MDNKEIKYLNGLLDAIDPDKYDFRLEWSEGKEVIGVVNNTEDKSLSDLYKNETFYRTFININGKIYYSLKQAIEYSYADEVMNNFNVFGKSTENEMLAFYYIENAIFRTSTMWDVLAQFYNTHYGIGKEVDKIYYQSFFKNEFKNASTNIKQNINRIIDYIAEDDETSITEGFWKGNHQFIKDYRNQMTHRNAPDVHSLSDIGINLKTPPIFLLRRVIEDYYTIINFIDEILELIRQRYFEES